MHIGKKWSIGLYSGNALSTRQFGFGLWYNDARTGLQINFYRWEFQLMRERKMKGEW